MRGKLYGVGIGPGDAELLTVKAVKIIQSSDIIAVPDTRGGAQTALEICKEYVGEKELMHCYTPMTRDSEKLEQAYEKNAEMIAKQLDNGKNIAFLTLGDPTIYSTYIYIHRIVEKMGYDVEIIPGIPSFCAAAARLNIPLCEKGEPLCIIPASYPDSRTLSDISGTKIYMKTGQSIGELVKELKSQDALDRSVLVERCGLSRERIVTDLTKLPEDLGYFTLVITKEEPIWSTL